MNVYVNENVKFDYSSSSNHNVYLAESQGDWNNCEATTNTGDYAELNGNTGPYSVKFTSPGIAYIYCTPHCSDGMKIQIHVN